MEPRFWHDRWRNNEIGFHEATPNSLLSAHFSRLSLPQDSRVLVPLCGKATDLTWLANQGYQVVGVELSETAVDAFFRSIGRPPQIKARDAHTSYRHESIEILVGDFFDLKADALGSVNAVYDRGALVALPTSMRRAYARHLIDLTNAAPQFVISYDYDQTQTDGPPFSVTGTEIDALYGEHYIKELIASIDISGPLANRCVGSECAWLLSEH